MVDLWAALPFAAMVAVECLDVGLTTLSKAAMSRGMSHFIFVLYSNALAAVILVPLSFFQRKKRPPLTLPLLCRFFFLGLTGITIMQNCVYTGISYSSPTLGSAMSNLIPAFTFVLAIIFRLEKLDIRSSRSQAKMDLHHRQQSPHNSLKAENWVLGALFLATACLSASIWNIIQAGTVKVYPAEITIVAFNCFFGTIQCAIVSLFAEKDPSAWKLRPDIELISIVYSAVFGSVVTICTQTWCINKKGPIFVAMFKPLGIAIAAIMGAIFLGDTLHVGSGIGALIIALGFYCVIWGQSQEQFNENYKGIDGLESSSTQRSPLLE
ncbi:WAT1-related-like protein [Cinnamomum micranthum f. kanehirae]|uniref:WAT1-related protein n=1 Tax=Cinnamomum micranthum f. kanehirae TaxID=337451 RepID=A0A443N2T7_9MAGN|nr:WAT1-related-like protein [Cinnamomum micranthum f. kanehirae]